MKRVILSWFIVSSCLALAQYGSEPTDSFVIYWSRTDTDVHYDSQFDGVFVVTKRWVVANDETPNLDEATFMAYGCLKNKEQVCQVLERLEVNGTTFEPREFKIATYYDAKRSFQPEDTQFSWVIEGLGLTVNEENLSVPFPPAYDLSVPNDFTLGTVTVTAAAIGEIPAEAAGFGGITFASGDPNEGGTLMAGFQGQAPGELSGVLEKYYTEGAEGWESGPKSGYIYVTVCNDVVKTYATDDGDKKLVFRACTQTIKSVSFTVE